MENSPPFVSLAPVRRWPTIGILSAAIAAVLTSTGFERELARAESELRAVEQQEVPR